MLTITRRKILIASLFLVIAFCFRLSQFPHLPGFNRQNLMSVVVPERLRGFLAARLWEKADDYMHAGPSPNKAEPFTAGSYAGNTDILPLLEIITRLVPDEPAPWLLLADNFARYLGSFDRAIDLLQKAIIYQPEIRKIHQFYAAIAYLKVFAQTPDTRAKKSALKYLQAAIKKFDQTSKKPPMPGYNLESYFILSARLYLEIGEPEIAVKAWENTKLPLSSDQGKLSSLLIKYRKTGQIPDLNEFKIETNLTAENKSLVASDSICQHPPGYHEHEEKRKHAPFSGRAVACFASLILFSLTITAGRFLKS
ncbi:MAG: hypothetical protein ACQETH_11355 [Candidatus Rifleibacteriota bacterium]